MSSESISSKQVMVVSMFLVIIGIGDCFCLSQLETELNFPCIIWKRDMLHARRWGSILVQKIPPSCKILILSLSSKFLKGDGLDRLLA